jgi:DNA-binding NtrC family response regulator
MANPAIAFARGDVSPEADLTAELVKSGFGVANIPATPELRPASKLRPDLADLILIGSSRRGAWVELDLAEQIRRLDASVPLILITDYGSEAHAIAAMRAGVDDYLKAPVTATELLRAIERNLPANSRRSSPVRRSDARGLGLVDEVLVGSSGVLREVKAYIDKVAATDTTVLISGETGTGKELVAELVHQISPRSAKPMVRVNCAALPDDLLESELFGYERGAFTGAHSSYPGKLKTAEGGTFFFDEIGEMSGTAQAKLLRFLENREVFRLGARSTEAIDVRVVAATNQELEQLVSENKFRKDLYYRLNVGRIHLPALKERKEDIPELFSHFLQQLNERCGSRVQGLCTEALTCLLHYDWPGNVRELKNLLEAIFIHPPAGKIGLGDLPKSFRGCVRDGESGELDERERLISTLVATNWNKSRAAQKLHWSRMTLYRKLHKYHID